MLHNNIGLCVKSADSALNPPLATLLLPLA
jgi:hypothetical protein